MLEEEETSFEGDPVEAIDGLLSDVKIDSVELQHEIQKTWIFRVLKMLLLTLIFFSRAFVRRKKEKCKNCCACFEMAKRMVWLQTSLFTQ
jgi:hypothetical protein